ncbi:MAG: hypothetical protein JO211_15555, partial [Acidobacteriaceae bacterium]|nr:hypothetical protein [Acidobacteriaceae bacterium]
QKVLEAEPKLKTKPLWWRDMRVWGLAAAILIAAAVFVLRPVQQPAGSNAAEVARMPKLPADRDFLTDQALKEVERTEAAYRQSIDKLSRLAEPELQKSASAVAVNCREKLLMLDSAISETRTSLDHNRFNVQLQTELAELYREKQQTLKELLTREQKN